MSTRNLIIFIFDGVLGDCFKKNLWSCSPVKLYLRRAAIKEIRRLRVDFQVVLFFISEETKPRKVIKYLSSKSLDFDGVYKSLNKTRFSQKFSNPLSKRPLKYSDNFQDFSQVYQDFGLQHEVHDKILIVTSISLTIEDFDRKGENLLFHKSSTNLHSFLCKAIPVPSTWSDLPVVLAIPDPRLHHNFAGASFSIISSSIYSLSSSNQEEWSWFGKFQSCKLESILTSACLASLNSKKRTKTCKKIEKGEKTEKMKKSENLELIEPALRLHKFLILKQTSLTHYNFIQDHAVSVQPLCVKKL